MNYLPIFDKPDPLPEMLYKSYYLGGDILGNNSNPCSLCGTDEFHFHASDLGGCQKRIYLNKLNKISYNNDARNNFLMDGHLHEKSILDYISSVNSSNFKIEPCVNEMQLQKKFDNFTLVGHPDAIGTVTDNGFLIECKAVSNETWKLCKDNIISDVWYGQIQTYLYLLNLKVGYLIVKNRSTSDILMPFRFEYDEEYFTHRIKGLNNIAYSILENATESVPTKEHSDSKHKECSVCPYWNDCWGKKK
jgi:hypothetical protein